MKRSAEGELIEEAWNALLNQNFKQRQADPFRMAHEKDLLVSIDGDGRSEVEADGISNRIGYVEGFINMQHLVAAILKAKEEIENERSDEHANRS